MKITVPFTQHVEVELSPRDTKNIALSYIRDIFEWPESYYISDGLVISERYGSVKTIREATLQDAQTEELIEKIYEKINRR